MMKVENETDANNNNLYDVNNNATTATTSGSSLSKSGSVAQMMGSSDSLANNTNNMSSSSNNVAEGCGGDDYNTQCGESDMGRTNLIVNYLPQNMTQDEIKSLFASIGPVDTCKLIKDKLTGQSLGYAFVKYANQDDADKAVGKLNSMRLQNKTIKVSHARPSSEQIKGANLYVCGLTKEFTQEELEKLFVQFGVIISSKILTDPKTGESKGVGFVRFDKRGEAENAIAQLNGKIIESLTEPLVVKFANSPTSVKSVMGLPLAPFACRGFYQPYRPAANGSYRYSPISSVSSAAAFPPPPPPPPLELIHGGGSTQMLSALNGLIHPTVGGGGGSLPTVGTLLTTGGTTLGSPNHHHHHHHHPHQPVMASPPPSSNSTTSPQQQNGNSSSSITFPGYPIFVYNLGPESDENTLWQLFGPFGAVQSVKIVRDMHTHKCKGFGFVTMTNYEEAVTAIGCLNGFLLHNRILQVSFKNTTVVSPTQMMMAGAVGGNGGGGVVSMPPLGSKQHPQLQPLF